MAKSGGSLIDQGRQETQTEPAPKGWAKLWHSRRGLWFCLLLGAVTLMVFWPVLQNQFVNYDDTAYVTENPRVLSGVTWSNISWAFSTGYFGNWHPLTWLSHMLDVEWFGLEPGKHHLTSLIFHIANTLLLFLVLNRMTSKAWASALVAAFFALHPLHVESVAWVSERKDVLSTFFALLGMGSYVVYAGWSRVSSLKSKVGKAVEAGSARLEMSDHASRTCPPKARRRRITHHPLLWYGLALVLFACGLMSKAMVVTLPFVLLLLDYWPLRRFQLPSLSPSAAEKPSLPDSKVQGSELALCIRTLRALVVEKIPFFALAVASTIVGFLLLDRAGAIGESVMMGWGERLARVAIGYGSYLGKMFWPVRLALPYPRAVGWAAGQALGGMAVVIGISTLALWKARSRPYVFVGWFWFLGMLAPVSGLVQLGAHAIADRYTYFSLVGIFIAIIWGLSELAACGKKGGVVPANFGVICSVVALGLLITCAGAARAQLSYWRDSERLYRHALEVTHGNFIAHNGLGLDLFNRAKVDEAITQYEAAIQINPGYDPAHANLGRALAQKGNYEEAAVHFEAALALRPDDVKTHNNLGNVLARQGRHEQAAAHFIEALRLDPNHASAHNNLAISCKKLGKTAEAIAQYREALRLQPDSLEALINLAWTLATDPDVQFRNGADAVQLATRACDLTQYQHALALTTLAAAYAETGMFHEGIAFAERAADQAGAGQTPMRVRLTTMLEGFRAGRPFREGPEHP